MLDVAVAWLYWPAQGSGKQPIYLLVASRGSDGAELWRTYVERVPDIFGGDADGGGTRDLLLWTSVPTPPNGPGRMKFELRDGASYDLQWTTGTLTGITTWREPVAVDVDGVAGDELLVSWYEADGDETTDDADYLAAFGPSGRLWAVRVTVEGTTPLG